MKGGINTKRCIQETALGLFARRGYNAVSIRDICGEVGIKESSIYYHYQSKQAIMDAIIEEVAEVVGEKVKSFDDAFAKAEKVSVEAMCKVAVHVLDGYYLHPYVLRVISMLSIERMHDENAAAQYRRIVFELPLFQQKKVFGQMMERGYIKGDNPETLAQQYCAIIYLAFEKNCVGSLAKDAGIELARQEISMNIADMYRKMRGVS